MDRRPADRRDRPRRPARATRSSSGRRRRRPRRGALIDAYRDACARHGRTPATIAIRRDVHVGADDADAERVAGPIVARGYRGFDPAAPVTGGVERVAAAFADLGEMGYTDVIVRHLADDQAEVLRSYERLAAVRARCSQPAR